jgi:hypothetical protein
MAEVQRLSEENDREDHADERLEVSKGGAPPGIEAGQAISAKYKCHSRAAGAEIEKQQQVADRQCAASNGGQLQAGAGKEKHETVAGAAGDNGQGVVRGEYPPPDDDVSRKAGRSGERKHIAKT